MHSNDFEKFFADFLERREYDEWQSALFMLVRISFEAGWKAAGGDPPVPQKIFEIVQGKASEPEKNIKNNSEE